MQILTCAICGESISLSETVEFSAQTFCADCFNCNYTTCENCGRTIRCSDAYYPDDDDYPYCDHCWEAMNQRETRLTVCTAR